MLNRFLARIYLFVKIRSRVYLNEKQRQDMMKLAEIHPDAVLNLDTSKIYNQFKTKESISIGAFTRFAGEMIVLKSKATIKVGTYCFIGPETRIWSADKITIGDRVLISHNVNVHDNISHPIDSRLRHQDFIDIFSTGLNDNSAIHEKQIIIGDDAWIGFNAIILKGVTIGKGAIIGAGAIITKDVPDYAVVVGYPQQIVKYTT